MKHTPHLVAQAGLVVVALGGCGDDGASPDADPPEIVSVAPGEDDDLWIHEPITVRFSEPIDPATVAGAVAVEDGDGAPLAAQVTLADDATALRVQVEPGTRVLGGLRVLLAADLADPAGNPLAATELAWTVPAWERASTGLDRGGALSAPALAAAPDGTVVAAWISGDDTSGLVVSRAQAGAWAALDGDPSGAGATGPTVAIDASGRPVVAWSEDGAIVVARHDGAAWAELASPGVGALPALAATPSGELVLAWASGDGVSVRRLVDDSWQPVGGGELAGRAASAPAVAADAAGTVAVAILTVGAQQAIRVHVFTGGTWAEAPSLTAPRPPDGEGVARHAIAIGADGLVAAWDEHSGHSWGVHAATLGNAWTRLGGALDIDPPADARGATLGIDAAGAPVVAWTELVESRHRGYAARWDGEAWRFVGGDAWNVDPGAALDAPALVLARGEVPVVGFRPASGADPVIARFNGPAAPRFGLDGRASVAGCSLPADSSVGVPLTLTDTGCFTVSGGRAIPAAGLVPFDITSELWSDGALKRRWLVVPDGQVVTRVEGSGWDVPVGTLLVKEFAIETTPGDPATRRPIETRFLIRRDVALWEGYSFEWRADGSDADLAAGDAGYTRAWPLSTGGSHVHSYPSRADCLTCHDDGVGFVLGVRTGQLARRFDYDGIAADQLATLEHIGLVTSSGTSFGAPFAAPHDPSASLYDRVRGYLAANCAHCHNPGGVRPTRDLRWETPLEGTNLCAVLVPGDPSASTVYQRVTARPGMPPLATLQTDPVITDLLGAWIASLASCP